MTTTLRPAGPAVRGPEGVRSRAFRICDNGRPVGTLTLAEEVRSGIRVGRIDTLAVDAPERRRGRATVAALAAEEILRTWGCRRAAVRLPASAQAAAFLAASLGYAERARTVEKTLTGPPPPPREDSELRELDEAGYARWAAAGGAEYTAPLSGDVRRAALRVLVHAGAEVGALWAEPGPARTRVRSVAVAGQHRRRGHGRELLAEAERLCRRTGGRTLVWTVPAGATAALGLSAAAGYRPAERLLDKPLA